MAPQARLSYTPAAPEYEDSTPLIQQAPFKRPAFFQGWRVSVAVGAAATFTVLILNVSLLLWAYINRPFAEPGTLQLYVGECERMETIFLWSHLTINLFGTILLASSNTSMQCLMAPTRIDLDRAHQRGSWLHIGILGLRNLLHVPWPRLVAWLLMALSSMPLHTIYNSVIFNSSSANAYHAFFVSEDFLRGGDWHEVPVSTGVPVYDRDSASTAPVMEDANYLSSVQNNTNMLNHYGIDACVTNWFQAYPNKYGNVLLVTQNTTHLNNTLLGQYMEHDPTHAANDICWFCNHDSKDVCLAQQHPFVPQCDSYDTGKVRLTVGHETDLSMDVEYCMAEAVEPQCEVLMSSTLLGVVITSNVIKLCCSAYLLFTKSLSRPLVTAGDAISSFLSRADPTTLYAPIMQCHDTWKGHWTPQGQDSKFGFEMVSSDLMIPTRIWNGGVRRWWMAAGISRWLFTLFLCAVLWIAPCVLLVRGWHGNYGRDTPSMKQFGSTDADYLFAPEDSYGMESPWKRPFMENVLIANLPQLLISFTYISYVNVLGSMLVARELSTFASHRKGLRVSEPRGSQRSTYWLSTPYRYSVPLAILMALLHWTISSSLFLVRFSVYAGSVLNGSWHKESAISTVGWSPIAVIVSLSIGTLPIIALLTLALKKLPSGMPLLSTSSAAISAACHHPPTKDGLNLAARPLMYGVHRADGGPKRACFSHEDVQPLKPGDTLGRAPQLSGKTPKPGAPDKDGRTSWRWVPYEWRTARPSNQHLRRQ